MPAIIGFSPSRCALRPRRAPGFDPLHAARVAAVVAGSAAAGSAVSDDVVSLVASSHVSSCDRASLRSTRRRRPRRSGSRPPRRVPERGVHVLLDANIGVELALIKPFLENRAAFKDADTQQLFLALLCCSCIFACGDESDRRTRRRTPRAQPGGVFPVRVGRCGRCDRA